jgi:hypothetical protein
MPQHDQNDTRNHARGRRALALKEHEVSARIKVSGNVLAILAGAVAASPALPAAAGEEGTQQEGLPAVARSVVNAQSLLRQQERLLPRR